jgi:hypothetical protein
MAEQMITVDDVAAALPDFDLVPAPDWLPLPPEPDPSLEGLDAASSLGALLVSMRAAVPVYKALRSVIVSGEKARAREIMRIRTRRAKSATRKEGLRRARHGADGTPTKKPTQELVTEAADLRDGYMRDAKRARTQALQAIARDERISMKRVRRIANRLAGMYVQELLACGSATLPRLGRFRLNTTGPRVRQVNVLGKVGLDGKRGLVECPVAVGVTFRTADSLRAALRVASQEQGGDTRLRILCAGGRKEDLGAEPWWSREDEDGSDAAHLQRLGTRRKPRLVGAKKPNG